MEPVDQEPGGSYPVILEIRFPERLDRVQVLARVLVLIVLGLLHGSMGGLFGFLYVLLPMVAAILISQRGGARFLVEDARWLTPALEWVVAFYAYLLFVTDELPLGPQQSGVRLRVRPGGTPTVGAALVRLVTSLPHVVVLAVLGLAAGIVWVVAAIAVLATGRCPRGLCGFQGDVVAWMARLFAYHASLVEPYPPFSLGASGTLRPDQSPNG